LHRQERQCAHAQGDFSEGQTRKEKKATMKSRNMIALFFVSASLALLRGAQGTPESALPGFNTADGDHALFSNTTGVGNSGFGWYSLFANTTNGFNTALGAGTLALATADDNTAVGAVALLLNSSGSDNTALGTGALLNNTTGISNTAAGAFALTNNTTGNGNIALGMMLGVILPQGITTSTLATAGWRVNRARFA
jgi:hypothetical protein